MTELATNIITRSKPQRILASSPLRRPAQVAGRPFTYTSSCSFASGEVLCGAGREASPSTFPLVALRGQAAHLPPTGCGGTQGVSTMPCSRYADQRDTEAEREGSIPSALVSRPCSHGSSVPPHETCRVSSPPKARAAI